VTAIPEFMSSEFMRGHCRVNQSTKMVLRMEAIPEYNVVDE
jgi:hypothetical protein